VVWDYQLIGAGATGEMDVMLVAIKAEIIQQITDSVEAAGLDVDLVDVAPVSVYNCARYNYPNLPECALIVDMGVSRWPATRSHSKSCRSSGWATPMPSR